MSGLFQKTLGVDDKTVLTATAASGGSGGGATFTLPAAGGSTINAVYLASIESALDQDPNNMALATAVIVTFRGGKNILASTIIAGPSFSDSSTTGINGLSIGAPTTSGTFQIFTNWTDGLNHVQNMTVTLRPLQTAF